MRLFAQKGYGSTSVADILQAAGVNAGSLYYLYPGKQDVLLDVLDTYLAGIHPMLLAPAWEGISDPVERVFALLRRYRFALESTDCTYGCPIGSIALEIHEPDPVVRDLMAANFTNWSAAIAGCFDAAADRLPQGVDRKALGEFVLTVMEGAVMQARTYRDIGYFDRNIAVLRDYITSLMATAKDDSFA